MCLKLNLFVCLLIVSCSLNTGSNVLAVSQKSTKLGPNDSYITFQSNPDAFPIFSEGDVLPILIDSQDFQGVYKVAQHLQQDLEQVCQTKPTILDKPSGKKIILAGTSGKNRWIDQLIEAGRIDTPEIEAKFEKFIITTIKNPFDNVEEALVIVGSDKRGTIYGIYDLSEKIGVSPWYYWADVPIEEKSFVGFVRGSYTQGEPKVKYRGIFLNDEEPALGNWARANFGDLNHEFYAHVFELILRLKGNYLWPAMWGKAIYDDDPLSPALANEMGVIIGSSHHEPLMRAHVEWKRYGQGNWDYRGNEQALQQFWREGMERMGSNESLVTIGMRGDGDEPMSEESNIALLEKIVQDQRQIIAETTGRPTEETPQMWALYKEVQDYYDKGMRVPDDVTLLLCDDNWGNIRKLSSVEAPRRSGGYGIYYHFDYVGGPRNYKWLNNTNLAKVWEQMETAYAHHVDQVWIVNVGDLKPMELPISFFLDMAWNPSDMSVNAMDNYYNAWAKRQFRNHYSDEIGDMLKTYSVLSARRKPELLNIPAYSLSQPDEWAQVIQEWEVLQAKAASIRTEIPTAYQDAYYQLVYFPVTAMCNIHQLYEAVFRNESFASIGDLQANEWADRIEEYYLKDSLLTQEFHIALAGGKWNHMMAQTHIGYTYWQQPDKHILPTGKRINKTQKNKEQEVQQDAQDKSNYPANFKGYVEQDGIISIVAAKGFKAYAEDDLEWLVIPQLGRSEDMVKLFPSTTRIDTNARNEHSPHLEYAVYSEKGGDFLVDIIVNPTIDYLNQGGSKLALSANDSSPNILNMHDPKHYNWEESVSNNAIRVKTNIQIKPGNNTIRIWHVDPGVAIEKIILSTEDKIDKSYLGWESTWVE